MSWRRTARPCGGGEGFRRGDALVNRSRFFADHQRPQRRAAAVHHPGHRPLQLRLLASDGHGPGRPAGGRRPPTGRAPQVGRTYGVPRITAELREAGERVNHKRIARMTRGIQLAAVRACAADTRTTVAAPAAAKDRTSSAATSPKRAEQADHEVRRRHHLPPVGQWELLHLATVIDLASRRLGDRAPHAHRPWHRRPGRCRTDPRQPHRGGRAHRPRSSARTQSVVATPAS